MGDVEGPPWVEKIHHAFDGSLRSILHLTEDERDVVYLRDDVDPVSEDRLETAFRTLMFDTVGADSDEREYEHGEMLCVTRRFEDAVELHFPVSATEGVAIALDGTAMEAYDEPIQYLHDVLPDGEE